LTVFEGTELDPQVERIGLIKDILRFKSNACSIDVFKGDIMKENSCEGVMSEVHDVTKFLESEISEDRGLDCELGKTLIGEFLGLNERVWRVEFRIEDINVLNREC